MIQKISHLTSQSIKSTFINMELEIPVMIYTERFYVSVDFSLGCSNYYEDYFKFPVDIAKKLCNNSVSRTFSFSNKLETCKVWMTIMMNGKVGDSKYYVELLFLTGMTFEELDDVLFSDNL